VCFYNLFTFQIGDISTVGGSGIFHISGNGRITTTTTITFYPQFNYYTLYSDNLDIVSDIVSCLSLLFSNVPFVAISVSVHLIAAAFLLQAYCTCLILPQRPLSFKFMNFLLLLGLRLFWLCCFYVPPGGFRTQVFEGISDHNSESFLARPWTHHPYDIDLGRTPWICGVSLIPLPLCSV